MSFQRLVREVFRGVNPELCVQSASLLVLQETSESFPVNMFEQVNLAAVHGGRVTIKPKDMMLWSRMKGYDYEGCLTSFQ